jgi:hypothetical protein
VRRTGDCTSQVRFNDFCPYIGVDHLPPGLSINAGRPLIYALLAATDPVRYSDIFHSSHSSFSHARYLPIWVENHTPLICIYIQSFLRALRALRHPEDETATKSHWPAPGGRLSTVIDLLPDATTIDLPPDATIIDLPPDKISSDTDAWTGELEKDDVQGYGRHAQFRAGETPTMSVRASVTNLEKGKGKERRSDERHNQRRTTMSALHRHF